MCSFAYCIVGYLFSFNAYVDDVGPANVDANGEWAHGYARGNDTFADQSRDAGDCDGRHHGDVSVCD